MKRRTFIASHLLVAAVFATAGSLVSLELSERETVSARQQHYIDRARVCIDAAEMLRGDDALEARNYLESMAIHSMMGSIPNSGEFRDLPSRGKTLFVQAQQYQQAHPDSVFEIHPMSEDEPKPIQVSELVASIPSKEPDTLIQ
ncbi:hypothetical protein [Rhodopirellula halodulae]|uniref:hypothetical protein n=1 Tax=Rhodopirellula halodulae TaxID=2894198 RepID=UPI001E5E5366|nr:hypothetical protein [Rhodopirellula sp. JC737]MCC9658541.1 hypothetical protein [Rhodopirellula sp. JC737]